jgi:hypothetical protein
MKIFLKNVSINGSDLLKRVVLSVGEVSVNLSNNTTQIEYTYSLPFSSRTQGDSEIVIDSGVMSIESTAELQELLLSMINNYINKKE